jgi:hypothetical protein
MEGAEMDSVYLVIRSVDWEGEDVIGVFSTYEKADAKAKEEAGPAAYHNGYNGYRNSFKYTTHLVEERVVQ